MGDLSAQVIVSGFKRLLSDTAGRVKPEVDPEVEAVIATLATRLLDTTLGTVYESDDGVSAVLMNGNSEK